MKRIEVERRISRKAMIPYTYYSKTESVLEITKINE